MMMMLMKILIENWKVLQLQKKMLREKRFMRVKFVEKNVYLQEV